MTRKKTPTSASQPTTVKVEPEPTAKNDRRPPLPVKVQNELWGRAAGRCEFKDCNILLYEDSLTGQRHNAATIAHIVAAKADGPRGDPVRSPLLVKAIENLMLTCKLHGSLIDNHEYVDQFEEAVLLDYKRKHEQRIKEATAALDDQRTALLVLQGRIGTKLSRINLAEVRKAIHPRWPGSDEETTIDLNDLIVGEDRASYWEAASEQIKDEIKSLLKKLKGKSAHVSVFALAPVPLLTLLGFQLGSRVDADLFQCHRDKPQDPWCWAEGEPLSEDKFELFEPETVDAELTDIALVVSVSRKILPSLVNSTLNIPHARFEIRARSTGTDFLKYRSQLTLFAAEHRLVMKMIGEQFPKVRRVHLFQASPIPLAIEAGRNLIEKADPEIIVYELNGDTYLPALTLNAGRRRA
ncbi:SAVED domain-containing protein [Deinococcus oregonensis]|uniref:SAVED domain-containing protein n=1 Tax=Deinococcus oregonensis TaxID=1805970 RepID=A0ABV6AY56_9DEIO